MAKRVTYVFLLLCLTIGLYQRITGTLGGFFAFTFDQGRDFLTLYELVYRGDIHLIGPPAGIDGVFHGVWWHWLLAPFYFFARGDPKILVAIFNIFSVSAIILAYALGKFLRGPSLGAILAAVVSVSPFFVSTGAQLWHPNVVPIATLFLLISILKFKRQQWSYLPIALSLGFIFEFEVGYSGLFLPAFLLACLIFKILPARKQILPAAAGFIIWLTPRILFELRHQFIQAKSLIHYIQNPDPNVFRLPLVERMIDRIRTLFFLFKDAYAKGNDAVAIFLLLGISIVTYRLLSAKTDSPLKKIIAFTLTILLLLIIGASIFPNALWSYYLIGAPAFILPLVGLTFAALITKFEIWGWVVFAVWFIFILSPMTLISPSSWEGDASVYKNQLMVVDAIYQDAQEATFNVQVYSPSVIDYTYHYLFLWYGEKKYSYSADREGHQKLAYFILEPDKWHPVLREAWLRERDGDGTIEWKKTFRGGIDVEKRVR